MFAVKSNLDFNCRIVTIYKIETVCCNVQLKLLVVLVLTTKSIEYLSVTSTTKFFVKEGLEMMSKTTWKIHGDG